MITNNERIAMTRRYHDLPKKVALRDSKIARKIIVAGDIEKDENKVLDIFLKEKKNLSDQRYWELLRSVWIICGKVSNTDLFRELLTTKRKHSYCFSTPEEAARLRNLPDKLVVYRACNDPLDGGLSWTISAAYALWYQGTFNKSQVISKEIERSQIFALIERNGEEEVLLL